jgi:hypothetical protein
MYEVLPFWERQDLAPYLEWREHRLVNYDMHSVDGHSPHCLLCRRPCILPLDYRLTAIV